MKKVLKSAAAILLVLALAFSAFAIGGVFAEETEPLSSFAVSAKGSGADSAALGTVSWWKSDVDGKYYMFMPSKSDPSATQSIPPISMKCAICRITSSSSAVRSSVNCL